MVGGAVCRLPRVLRLAPKVNETGEHRARGVHPPTRRYSNPGEGAPTCNGSARGLSALLERLLGEAEGVAVLLYDAHDPFSESLGA